MSKFNFEKPIKASVIFEEMEPDELNASLDKIAYHNIPSASTTTLNTMERELPNGSTKSFSDVVCGIMKNNILSTEYDKYCRTSQQIPTVINVENNNDYNIRQEKTLQNVFSYNGQNLKFPVNIPKTRILTMLDSVSHNIIEVWKCYHNIINNHFNQETFRSFLKYKYYCFSCSYSAVNLIIIPHEYNQTFIEKFINRTVILAHGMSLFQITREFVLGTMKDMISWSKCPMQNKINLERKVRNQKSIESSKNNVDNICIFSSGTEERQLSISIAPELLKKHLNCETVEDAHKQQNESNRGHRTILADNSSYEKNDDNFHKKRSRTSAKNLSISTLSAPQENLSNTVLLGNDLETINLLTDDVNDQNPNAISRSSISRDSGFVSPVDRPPSRDPKVNRSFRVIININSITY